MEFWNLIVQSNTFNFLIFIGLFALLFKKINFGAMMDSLQAKVMSLIEDAKKAKDDSIVELKKTQEISSKVPTEVRNILDNAEVTADRLGKRILEEAEKQVNSIYKTTDNVVESEGQRIISNLSQKTALASLELAKSHIVKTLKEKPQYHVKFIEDSINELDRFNI